MSQKGNSYQSISIDIEGAEPGYCSEPVETSSLCWDYADELLTRLGNAIEVGMNSMTAKLSNLFTGDIKILDKIALFQYGERP